jgi:serine/threonine protein kinase
VTTAPFLSRPLGNFLLIAQLSEDALGTVFRAIYAPDERRFVRLRILQSPELMPEAVFSAIEKGDDDARALIHRAVVPNAEVGLADGLPYLAWDEVAGWTLDQLLERVRALGVRIPPEYALLVAERIATALEYASRAVPGRPITHGLVWPGFVSISSNAEIRLGGFGLAEALLNSLHRPRIGREVAPYAAPEARETGEVGPDTDVYSVGVILTELLTGRRPRRSNPAEALDVTPSVPEELRALVARSLAPSGQRFSSIVEMRRALEEILTASPYALYTGNLALFLYRLLNPEGQNVVDAADGDSTNPVEGGARTVDPEPDSAPLLPPFETALPTSIVPFENERAEPRFHVAMAVLPAPAQLAAPKGTVWIGRVGFAVAASLVAAGVFFPGHRSESVPEPSAAATRIASGSPTAVPADVLSATLFTGSLAARQAPPARDSAAGSGSAARASVGHRPASDDRAAAVLARRSAESLRLRAALARIEAERLDAGVIARDLYAEAQGNENEGNRLLRQGAYEPAQPALMRATQLYRMAEDLSREERVRLVRLSSPQ